MEEKHLVVPDIKPAQTPPEVKIQIQTQPNNTDIIRLASMGSSTDLGGFRKDREYWRQIAFTSNTFNGNLTLKSTKFDTDESEAKLRDNFFTTSFPTNALDVSRTGATWNNSERAVPGGRNAFLYEMAHPDGGTNPAMGVLFEIDQRTNLLLAVVFYVAASWTSPPSSPLWGVQTISPAITLSKKDSTSTSALTAPPSGKSWWHTVMG